MFKKIMLLVIYVLLLSIGAVIFFEYIPMDVNKIDISDEPQQTPYTADIHFTQKIGDLESKYTPISKS